VAEIFVHRDSFDDARDCFSAERGNTSRNEAVPAVRLVIHRLAREWLQFWSSSLSPDAWGQCHEGRLACRETLPARDRQQPRAGAEGNSPLYHVTGADDQTSRPRHLRCFQRGRAVGDAGHAMPNSLGCRPRRFSRGRPACPRWPKR
jgi:hypothetical protein